MKDLRIAIGSDHGGFEQKGQLKRWLEKQGANVVDYGCDSEESVDYPDYALPVAESVSSGAADFGVLVCGTGIGMALAANKVAGIRAVNIVSPAFAELSRQHNNANVITLSGRFIDVEENKLILKTFFSTEFEGGRHVSRVKKIMDIESK